MSVFILEINGKLLLELDMDIDMATVQHLINDVLQGLLDQFEVAYLDDILFFF